MKTKQKIQRETIRETLKLLKNKGLLEEGIGEQLISDWEFPEDVKSLAYSYQIAIENGEERDLSIRISQLENGSFKISSKFITTS